MGASGKMLMFHRNHWWYTEDGGHNFQLGNLPGGGGAFDYIRQAGSRSEPVGTVFGILDAPAPTLGESDDESDDHSDDYHSDDDDKVTICLCYGTSVGLRQLRGIQSQTVSQNETYCSVAGGASVQPNG